MSHQPQSLTPDSFLLQAETFTGKQDSLRSFQDLSSVSVCHIFKLSQTTVCMCWMVNAELFIRLS
jgi:hypothetical protein